MELSSVVVNLLPLLLLRIGICAAMLAKVSKVNVQSVGKKSSGITVTDIDGDGIHEVIVAVLNGANLVFNYDPVIRRYTEKPTRNPDLALVHDVLGSTISVCACDVDGDGIEDLYLHNTNDVNTDSDDVVPDRLIKFQNGEFVDLFSLPENVKLAPRWGGHSVACIDVSGTGLYAFLVTTYTKDGTGTYRLIALKSTDADPENPNLELQDLSMVSGFNFVRDGRGVLVAPLVGDDDYNDVFITNDNAYFLGSSFFRHDGSNVLMRNNKDGTFTDISRPMGTDDADENGRGAAIVDLGHDGVLDLLTVNYLGPSRIYKHSTDVRNLTFKLQPESTYSRPSPANILLAADFDNNGRLDVLKAAADGDNIYPTLNSVFTIYENITDVSEMFVSQEQELELEEFKDLDIKGVSIADLDEDGYLEIFVAHRAASGVASLAIFRGLSKDDGNWLRVLPLTRQGAPARGSKVSVTLSDYSQRHVVVGAACAYMCQTEPVAHFGFGKGVARELKVTWPDGHVVKRFLCDESSRKVLKISYSGMIEEHRFLQDSMMYVRSVAGQRLSLSHYLLLLILFCDHYRIWP